MEELLHYYPIFLYILGSILLIILIILGIKLIKTINKANIVLDDVYNKTRSLNGLFHVLDMVTDTLSSISDSVAVGITNMVGRLFHRKKKEESEEDTNE